jgi:hypothetical protein
LKVVLDTNVIVSALINTNGIPAKVLALILTGNIKHFPKEGNIITPKDFLELFTI